MDEESEKINSLIQSLHHPDKKAAREAVEALISLANTAPEIAVELRSALDRAPAEQRWPIAYVLAQISPLSAPCLEALKAALDISDSDIRWAVALLLVRVAKKSDPGIVAHLVDLLKSGRPTQRRMAVYCLRDIGAQDPLSRRGLLDALCDPDPLVRVAVVTSLKARPEIGREALDHLLRLFAVDPDSRVRASVAFALAYLGGATDKILGALKDASEGPDLRLNKAARAALALLEKK